MKRALVVLVACKSSSSEPPAPKPIARDAQPVARTWPVGPAPTLPLDVAWPPSADELAALPEDGIANGGIVVYADTSPRWWPRLWVKGDLDLMALETAWGKLARDSRGQALWWNEALRIRARFDAAHSRPTLGRGIELSYYAPTIDRIANLDELFPQGTETTVYAPPGEWDPSAVVVNISSPGGQGAPKRVRLTVRVDGPPATEAALHAKLAEIWGAPTESGDAMVYGKDRVTVRPVAQVPAVEITYLAP